MQYSNLLSKGKINNLELKNKVVMSAMGISLANPDGTPNKEVIKFYEERAKGGVGLIINEYTRVSSEDGIAAVRQLGLTSDEFVPEFKKLTDAVHSYGTKIFAQLHHPGREGFNALNDFNTMPAASVRACGLTLQATHEMTIDEINVMVGKFVSAARRAYEAGYDGVELHAAHGYLIQQFLSPYTNKREDQYGGSLENRMRFILEIIAGIKKEVPGFTISVRISADEFLAAIGSSYKGLVLEESIEIAKKLEEAGIDVLNVSAGIYETANATVEPMSYEEGWRSYLSQTIKQHLTIPVMGVAVIRHPEFAEKLLADGNQDFIVMGRSHLADSEWVNKVAEGCEDEIRYCISCLHCFETYLGASLSGDTLECAINPRCGSETKFDDIKHDGEGRNIVIIGSGPSGLESARVLAERGFTVTVFEKEDVTGGQLNLANVPPHKEKINWFIEYQRNIVNKLGVNIKYGIEPTKEDITALNPYAVILATGAKPLIINIEGIDGESVVTAEAVLSGDYNFEGKKIHVIGSGMTGLETAELLSANNQVAVVEAADTIAPKGYMQNVLDVSTRLAANNVKMLPFHSLQRVTKSSVILKNMANNNIVEHDVDVVVLAIGVKPNVISEYESVCDKVVSIGDCNKPGRIANAVRSGYEVAYNIK